MVQTFPTITLFIAFISTNIMIVLMLINAIKRVIVENANDFTQINQHNTHHHDHHYCTSTGLSSFTGMGNATNSPSAENIPRANGCRKHRYTVAVLCMSMVHLSMILYNLNTVFWRPRFEDSSSWRFEWLNLGCLDHVVLLQILSKLWSHIYFESTLYLYFLRRVRLHWLKMYYQLWNMTIPWLKNMGHITAFQYFVSHYAQKIEDWIWCNKELHVKKHHL